MIQGTGIIRAMPLLWLLPVVAVLLFPSAVRADDPAVGVLTEMAGDVRLLRADNYLQVERGVEVHPQDIIETGANGTAQIDLKDGSVLRLGPGSRLALSDYKLDKDRNVISATVDVLTGWLRFAVSKLRKDDSKYRINAPSLTIGIRGTEGVVEARDQQGGVHLVSGRIEVGGQDAQGKPIPPVQVNAGQYIQRLQGQAFRRYAAAPPAFQKRVPRGVVGRLVLKPLRAGERPIVRPRVVRKLTPAEARQFIRRHPHARDRLQRRFRPLIGPGKPGTRRESSIRSDADGGSTVRFGDGVSGRRLPAPDGARHKAPAPGQGGIGGQLPANRLPPALRPGAGKPPLARKPYQPGQFGRPPGRPAIPPVPVPYPNMKPGTAPPRPGHPASVMRRPLGAAPIVQPVKKPASEDGQKRPEGQNPGSSHSGNPPDSAASSPPPSPKPPNLMRRPPPRKMIRMMRY